jgi:hypothetical protein
MCLGFRSYRLDHRRSPQLAEPCRSQPATIREIRRSRTLVPPRYCRPHLEALRSRGEVEAESVQPALECREPKRRRSAVAGRHLLRRRENGTRPSQLQARNLTINSSCAVGEFCRVTCATRFDVLAVWVQKRSHSRVGLEAIAAILCWGADDRPTADATSCSSAHIPC